MGSACPRKLSFICCAAGLDPVSEAVGDSIVNCWNDKRFHSFWRATTAINEGDSVELRGICSESAAGLESPGRSGRPTKWSGRAEQPAEQRNWAMLRAIHRRQPRPTAWDAASASCSEYVSDFGVDSSEWLSGELVIVDVGQPEDVGARRRTRRRLDEYAFEHVPRPHHG